MKQTILDKTSYDALSNIQKGFFDGFRKSFIKIFDDGSHDFSIEMVKICEDSAYTFIGELSDETLNPTKYTTKIVDTATETILEKIKTVAGGATETILEKWKK